MRKTILMLVAVIMACSLILSPAAAAAEGDSTYNVTPSFSVRIPDGWTVENGSFFYENDDVQYQVSFNTYGLRDTSGLDSASRREHLRGCLDYFCGGDASEVVFTSFVDFGGRESLVFSSALPSLRLAGYMCFDAEDKIIMIIINGGRIRSDAPDPVNRRELLLYMLGMDTAQVYSHSETPYHIQLPSDIEIMEETDSGITARLRTDTYLYGLQTGVFDYSYDADMLDLISYDDILTGMWNQSKRSLIEQGYTIEQVYFQDYFSFPLSSLTDAEALGQEISQWSTSERKEGGYPDSCLNVVGTCPDGGKMAMVYVSGGYNLRMVMLFGWKLDASSDEPDLKTMMNEIIVHQ